MPGSDDPICTHNHTGREFYEENFTGKDGYKHTYTHSLFTIYTIQCTVGPWYDNK